MRFNCRFADIMRSTEDGSRGADFRNFNRILQNTVTPIMWGLTPTDLAIINGTKGHEASAGDEAHADAIRRTSNKIEGILNAAASNPPQKASLAGIDEDDEIEVGRSATPDNLPGAGSAPRFESGEVTSDEPPPSVVQPPTDPPSRVLRPLASKRGARDARAHGRGDLDVDYSLRQAETKRTIPMSVMGGAMDSDNSDNDDDNDTKSVDSDAPELHMHEGRPLGLAHVVHGASALDNTASTASASNGKGAATGTTAADKPPPGRAAPAIGSSTKGIQAVSSAVLPSTSLMTGDGPFDGCPIDGAMSASATPNVLGSGDANNRSRFLDLLRMPRSTMEACELQHGNRCGLTRLPSP